MFDGTTPFWTNAGTLPNGTGILLYQSGQDGIPTAWWSCVIPYIPTPPTSASAGAQVVISGLNLAASDGSLPVTLVDSGNGNKLVSKCTSTAVQATCSAPAFGANYSLAVCIGTVCSSPFTLSVTGQAAPPPPIVVSVVNGASFTSPITGGSVFTAHVSNLKPTTQNTAPSPGVTNLGGVSMTICGIPAYLTYLGPDSASGASAQINGIVPKAARGESTCSIVVTDTGISSPAFTAQAGENPAEFQYMIPNTDTQIAIRTLSDGATLYVPPSLAVFMPKGAAFNSAVPTGTNVTLWVTGFAGATIVDIQDGLVNPTGSPFVSTYGLVVKIGGVPATVLYAGTAPGLSGLYQINIITPVTLDGTEGQLTLEFPSTNGYYLLASPTKKN